MDGEEDAHTRRPMYSAYMTPSARKSDKVRRDSERFLYVDAEENDVIVLHDVVFAFAADLAALFCDVE